MSNTVFKKLLLTRIIVGVTLVLTAIFWDKFYIKIFPFAMDSNFQILLVALIAATWILIFSIQALVERKIQGKK